ncbi:hypothetical protein [Tindallia californiensis]|uniref:Uncharacterized protein n=1 Tax=Tindallia californiensis TaxID=159292 RepID=A0A1H3LDB4_9FIRM|nr:hypothetical protein [Tindallia californiensis]SDY61865.1 hypothetical protein SAMN05192546_103152 [Tindallia californiensis]
MGREFLAKCKKCGEIFNVREGGGKDSVLLHCDTCGKEKLLTKNDLDKNVPLIDQSGISYHERIEAYAGECRGGKYRIKAKARCPICNSDEYEPAVDRDKKVSMAYYD